MEMNSIQFYSYNIDQHCPIIDPTQIQHDLEVIIRFQEKGRPQTVKEEMAVSEAEDRLGDPDSEIPQTTVPTVLSQERLIRRRITSVWDTHITQNSNTGGHEKDAPLRYSTSKQHSRQHKQRVQIFKCRAPMTPHQKQTSN